MARRRKARDMDPDWLNDLCGGAGSVDESFRTSLLPSVPHRN